MKRVIRFFERGNVPIGFMAASVFLAFASIMSFLVIPSGVVERVEVTLDPLSQNITLGNEFTTTVFLESSVPINALEGMLRFDSERLEITNLNFRDSIADLWVEEPRYDNNQGTISFIGGTTHHGGFVGSGPVVEITFRSKAEGSAALYIDTIRVLRHDGSGTDATVAKPTDAAYIIDRLQELPHQGGTTLASAGAAYEVVAELPPSPDLNGDGKYSVADLSIFMLNMRSGNYLYDFNQDGAGTSCGTGDEQGEPGSGVGSADGSRRAVRWATAGTGRPALGTPGLSLGVCLSYQCRWRTCDPRLYAQQLARCRCRAVGAERVPPWHLVLREPCPGSSVGGDLS